MNLSTLPILSVTVLCALLTAAHAHSWMTNPNTYNTVYKATTCKGDQCGLPCPTKWSNMNNSESEPEAIYQRGETVDVKWVRNNHRGGIVRLAVVPVDAMFNQQAHRKLALFYGCWDSGIESCPAGYRWCGSDKDNLSFHKKIRIPNCLPDGNYVFSYAWFGGLHFSLKKGHFPDYHHCSHIEVRGGALGGNCQAVFEAGVGKTSDGSKCRTSATDSGQCVKNGCKGKGSSIYAIPKVFENGSPPPFNADDVLYVRDNPTSSLQSWPNAPPTGSDKNEDIPGTEFPSDPLGPETGGERDPNGNDPPSDSSFKCHGGVCCSPTCKKCVSRRCKRQKTLSTDECCRSNILSNGRYCSSYPPPCICDQLDDNLCPKNSIPGTDAPTTTIPDNTLSPRQQRQEDKKRRKEERRKAKEAREEEKEKGRGSDFSGVQCGGGGVLLPWLYRLRWQGLS